MDLVEMQKWAFIPSLPDDIAPIRDLLIRYSKISPPDINAHLIRIRDRAWALSRAPFIGRWKFLRLSDSRDPCYLQVLFRLSLSRSRDAFLDLGCGFGQALRQLRADGIDGSQLFGLDSDSGLIMAGYDLFQDRNTLGATFFVGDIIDPEDQHLHDLDGKVTIIHAGSFFHLFTWTEQLFIGKRIVDFLKPGTQNALIYGRHAGAPSPRNVAADGSSPYLHNQSSFQRLWDEVGQLTKTKWKVEVEHASVDASQLPAFQTDVQAISFTVYQIPWI
ncbi:Asnovolin E/Chermesin D methyltransferase nvfJ [Cladobotryum mycophilum]|uniref:Asnovolin E/Chermesin D methyltransferase nvfJ n=1 Tax=Cladobotryum mycophilum TaxID=491253 RepID=A0ABR0SU27_9HYPO